MSSEDSFEESNDDELPYLNESTDEENDKLEDHENEVESESAPAKSSKSLFILKEKTKFKSWVKALKKEFQQLNYEDLLQQEYKRPENVPEAEEQKRIISAKYLILERVEDNLKDSIKYLKPNEMIQKLAGLRSKNIDSLKQLLAKDDSPKEVDISKRKCFKCGEKGHLMEDCPSEKNKCFNCWEMTDHKSANCPNPKKEKPVVAKKEKREKTLLCNKCRENGHEENECLNPNTFCCNCWELTDHKAEECPNSKKMCYNCWELSDHKAADCPNPKAEKPKKGARNGDSSLDQLKTNKKCLTCGKKGHLIEDCPSEKKVCFNCWKPADHESANCPNPKKAKPKKENKKKPGKSTESKKTAVCVKCKEEGHKSFDCPNPNTMCHNCWQLTDHKAANCPNPKVENPKKGKKRTKEMDTEESKGETVAKKRKTDIKKNNHATIRCYKCSEIGHSISECVNPKKMCFNCWELSDHNSSNCPNPKVEKPEKTEHKKPKSEKPSKNMAKQRLICHNCKEKGHKSSECPNPNICYNCWQQTDHKADECPNKDKMCYNCWQLTDHKANNCPNPKVKRPTKGGKKNVESNEQGPQITDEENSDKMGGGGKFVRLMSSRGKSKRGSGFGRNTRGRGGRFNSNRVSNNEKSDNNGEEKSDTVKPVSTGFILL